MTTTITKQLTVPPFAFVVCCHRVAATHFLPHDDQDAREKVHIAIKTKLDASVLSRAKADEKFQSVVAEELAAIKNSIRVEAEVGAYLALPLGHQCATVCSWPEQELAPSVHPSCIVRCSQLSLHSPPPFPPPPRHAQVREKEDDEIVESMTRYTTKLQASLHIINSMDTD
jgi:hypothetical protein